MDELLLADGHDQRWPQVDREQQLRHRGQPDVRQPAGLLHVPAGQLRRPGGRLPGRRRRRPRQHGRRLPDARARRPTTSRCSAAVTWPASSAQDNESAKKLVKFLTVARTSGRRRTAQPAPGSRRAPTSTLSLLQDETSQADRHRSPYESTDFVFDGSDQMPGEVGSGSFWREMTAWISGQEDAEDGVGQHREQLAGLTVRPGVPGGSPPGTPTRPRVPPAADGRLVVTSRSSTRSSPSSAAWPARSSCTSCSTSSPNCCPGEWEDRVKPYLYLLPALAAISALPDLPDDPDVRVQLRQRDQHRVRRLRQLHQPADARRASRTRCSTRCSGSSSSRPARSCSAC